MSRFKDELKKSMESSPKVEITTEEFPDIITILDQLESIDEDDRLMIEQIKNEDFYPSAVLVEDGSHVPKDSKSLSDVVEMFEGDFMDVGEIYDSIEQLEQDELVKRLEKIF